MGDNARIEAYLKGLVQGVGMRYYVLQTAKSLGLKGYTKNLTDGRVEVIAEGDSSKLIKLLEQLEHSQVGRVINIDVTWSEATDEFEDFRIEP